MIERRLVIGNGESTEEKEKGVITQKQRNFCVGYVHYLGYDHSFMVFMCMFNLFVKLHTLPM